MKKIRKKLIAVLGAAALLCSMLCFPAAADENAEVILGGSAFGVKLFCDRLSVVGFAEVDGENGPSSPASDSGILLGDVITAVDGEKVTDAETLVLRIESSGGKEVRLTVLRDGVSSDFSVTPVKSASDGKFRLGMWLRDSTAGIGTVTFVIPDTLAFGGLGHGICDVATGEVIEADRGVVCDVTVNSIRRGYSGSPGELQGTLLPQKTGALLENTPDGVFGVCFSLPDGLCRSVTLPICPLDEVKAGPAKLFCTLGDDGVVGYDVEISDVSSDPRAVRSFSVRVTDRALLERTGGIVQGMSGSPIVQNGRLIGAVTHVLVSDPTSGYGIFIEKMLDELPPVLR